MNEELSVRQENVKALLGEWKEEKDGLTDASAGGEKRENKLIVSIMQAASGTLVLAIRSSGNGNEGSRIDLRSIDR
jgi:hypothetical protein